MYFSAFLHQETWNDEIIYSISAKVIQVTIEKDELKEEVNKTKEICEAEGAQNGQLLGKSQSLSFEHKLSYLFK